MADMLSDGLDWMTTQLHANASRNVTYKRGTHTVTLTAIVGPRRMQRQDGPGKITEWSERDFIIKASALILNSVATEPAEGDFITDSKDSARYQVVPLPTERCFQRTDNGGQFRCHTKRVRAG